ERSISLNDKADQITMHTGDIRQIREMFSHSSFDVITVNPPYFTNNQPLKTLGPHSIARHEVHIDLAGVVTAATCLVQTAGRLYTVHRAERSMAAVRELDGGGFRITRLQYVYNDENAETAMFVLVEAVFHSQAYADVLPPFYI